MTGKKLTKGERYNLATVNCVGWTEGESTGYNLDDYFRDGVYQGPDQHGVEPLCLILTEER